MVPCVVALSGVCVHVCVSVCKCMCACLSLSVNAFVYHVRDTRNFDSRVLQQQDKLIWNQVAHHRHQRPPRARVSQALPAGLGFML